MNRLGVWLLARIDETLAQQAADIFVLRAQLADAQGRADEIARERDNITLRRNKLLGVINALLKGAGLPITSACPDWMESPISAEQAMAGHVAEKLESVELRASKAERDAEDLRTALSDERHAHDKTSKKLDALDEQNQQLWDVIQRDRARVQAEIAGHNRRRAAAENEARRRADEDEDPSPIG